MRLPRPLSPVYFKELTQLALGRRLLWMKLAALAVLLGLTGLVLADVQASNPRLGAELVQALAICTLVLIALLAPPLVAGVVCGERQANTLGLLFLTRLSRWQIVQDKGLSRLTLLGLLALLAVPFLYGGLLFGGVEPAQALAVLGYLATTVLLCGAACLLASAVCPTFGSALMAAYGLELLLVLLLPAVISLPSRNEALLLRLSPLAGLTVILNPWMLSRRAQALTYWYWSVGYGAAMYLLAVTVGALLIRHQAVPEDAAGGGRRWWHPLRLVPALWRQGLRWLTPIGWVARLPSRVGHHPIGWRVGRLTGPRLLVVRLALLGWWVAAVLIAIVAVSLLLSGRRQVSLYGDFLDESELYQVGYALWTPFLALCLTVLAGSSLAGERQGGTWEVLLSTRQPGWRIVLGYWEGLAKTVLGATLVVAVWLQCGWCLASNHRVAAAAPTLAFLVYGLLLVTIGLRCSLAAATPTRGVLWALGINLAVIFVPLVTGAILDELVSGFDWKTVGVFSPGYWWAEALDRRFFAPWERGGDYALYSRPRTWGGFLLHLAGTLALCGGLLLEMARTFDRRTGRQQERP